MGENDVLLEASAWAWARRWAWETRTTFWMSVGAAPAVGLIIGVALSISDQSRTRTAITGVTGIVLGALVASVVVHALGIVLAPYRQRDAARSALEEARTALVEARTRPALPDFDIEVAPLQTARRGQSKFDRVWNGWILSLRITNRSNQRAPLRARLQLLDPDGAVVTETDAQWKTYVFEGWADLAGDGSAQVDAVFFVAMNPRDQVWTRRHTRYGRFRLIVGTDDRAIPEATVVQDFLDTSEPRRLRVIVEHRDHQNSDSRHIADFWLELVDFDDEGRIEPRILTKRTGDDEQD